MNTKRGNIGSDRSLWYNSLHSIIIQILKTENRPMRVNEITREVLKKRRIASGTPQNSISAILQSSVFVKRIDRGIYKLVKTPKA